MAFFPCYPLNEPAECSQNRSRFTSEVTKHSYEVPSNSLQTVATATFYFSLEDFNEGPFGESQSERQLYLAGSQNRMAQLRYLIGAKGSTGVQPNSGVEGEFATFRSSGTPPCNFGFSTKYRDSETGLNYYGYRYYSANLGRWLGRDPIGTNGGLNIYSFCNNSPTIRFDAFGMRSATAAERVFWLALLGSPPLARKFINNYMDDSGRLIEISESEMTEVGAKISIKQASQFSSKLIELAQSGKDEIDINNLQGDAQATTGRTLGHFYVIFDGTLKGCGAYKWEFDGWITFRDEWDLDPKEREWSNPNNPNNVREPVAEIQTRLGNIFIPGRGFPVFSVSASGSQKESQDEFQWKGTGKIGSPMFEVR